MPHWCVGTWPAPCPFRRGSEVGAPTIRCETRTSSLTIWWISCGPRLSSTGTGSVSREYRLQRRGPGRAQPPPSCFRLGFPFRSTASSAGCMSAAPPPRVCFRVGLAQEGLATCLECLTQPLRQKPRPRDAQRAPSPVTHSSRRSPDGSQRESIRRTRVRLSTAWTPLRPCRSQVANGGSPRPEVWPFRRGSRTASRAYWPPRP